MMAPCFINKLNIHETIPDHEHIFIDEDDKNGSNGQCALSLKCKYIDELFTIELYQFCVTLFYLNFFSTQFITCFNGKALNENSYIILVCFESIIV
ncbi:unnamed protein product [Cunninghamella echinulata]